MLIALQDAGAAGIKVTRKSMGCREFKDRMLLGSTLVIALVDKTRLAGHAGQTSGHKAASLGMSVRMMLAPAYTGGVEWHSASAKVMAISLTLYIAARPT